MLEFWGLVVAALIGAAAWLYQRAWERQERRLVAYTSVVDRLPAFTVKGQDTAEIDAALRELRRLWLICPDDVIQSCNAFLATTETGSTASDDDRERALAECILAMRRDVSFCAAVIPRFCRTRLETREFKIKSANPDKRRT